MADIAIGLGSFTETDVASAATCDIGAVSTIKVRITGSVTITSFGSSTNRIRFIRFADPLTLTHNAVSLRLPTNASIAVEAGDTCFAMSTAAGNWVVVQYQRDTGLPLNADLVGIAGLSPSNDDLLQRKAGAWINRTPAQVADDLRLAGVVLRLGGSGLASTAGDNPGVTTEITLGSLTIPGGFMGPNGWLEVGFRLTVNNNANNKTFRVRLGATAVKQRIMTTVISEQGLLRLNNKNSESAQGAFDLSQPTYFGQTGNAHASAAIDTSVNQTMTLTGQLATGTDTIKLESWDVKGAYIA